MCHRAFINLQRHTHAQCWAARCFALTSEWVIFYFAYVKCQIGWVCVQPTVWVCTWSIDCVLCACISVLVQRSSLRGVTCGLYLFKVSLPKAFKENCVCMRTNICRSLFLRCFIFMRVLSVLFQSAIPLVNTEMLFSFQMLILHFAFLRSSPYSVAPSLNSHSYYTQTHTDTLSVSLPVMLCCLSFPL